jgi:hypothetical protein
VPGCDLSSGPPVDYSLSVPVFHMLEPGLFCLTQAFPVPRHAWGQTEAAPFNVSLHKAP